MIVCHGKKKIHIIIYKQSGFKPVLKWMIFNLNRTKLHNKDYSLSVLHKIGTQLLKLKGHQHINWSKLGQASAFLHVKHTHILKLLVSWKVALDHNIKDDELISQINLDLLCSRKQMHSWRISKLGGECTRLLKSNFRL